MLDQTRRAARPARARHQPAAGAPPRSTRQLLADRDVGCLFWGKLSSTLGAWAYAMAAAVAVFDATGSSLAVGLTAAAQYLPQFVLAPKAGSWTDSGDPRRQMLSSTLFMFAGSAALTVWVAVDGAQGWRFAWVVIVASMSVGIGIVLGSPAMQAALPRMVSVEELPTAVGLNFTPMAIARVAGPLAGVALLATIGVVAGFALPTALQVLALLAFLALRVPPVQKIAKDADYSVRHAVRHLRGNRPLVLLLVIAAATAFGSEPSLTLAPALTEELAGARGLTGALSASFGAGTAFGLVVVRILTRTSGGARWGPLVALGFQTLGLGLAAVSPVPFLALLGFVIAGMGFAVSLSSMTTSLLLGVPEALRGRIMAFWMMCFVGCRPLAGVICGALTDAVSVRVAIAAMALVTGAAMLVARPALLTPRPA